MKTKLKSLLVAASLPIVASSSAVAGNWQQFISSNGSFSGYANGIPAGAQCSQVGAAYRQYGPPENWYYPYSFTICNGPLGNYSVNDYDAQPYLNGVQGPVSGGNHYVYLYNQGVGYAGVAISW